VNVILKRSVCVILYISSSHDYLFTVNTCFYLGILDLSPGEYMEQVSYVFQVGNTR
jgi:hypothetical protein